MEEKYQVQRLEALEELYHYSKKLIPSVENMINELREEMQEDSKNMLNIIVEGLNWELSVLNHTLDLFNQNEEAISKDSVNSMISQLNSAIKEEDYLKVSNIFEADMLPVLNKMQELVVNIVDVKEN